MKSKISLKICSMAMAFLFSASVIIPPSHLHAETAVSYIFEENQLFAGLSPDVCEVEEVWFSPQQDSKQLGSEPLVILLQEAHVNYGSQKNIVKTLEHFQSKFKSLNLPENLIIGLEGNPSEKEIDPVIFRAFPLPDVTRSVTDSFMYEGKIDGAEFYAINANQNARLFGIEEDSLYQKNLELYKTFHKNQEVDTANLNKLRGELEILKEKVYAKPLKDLEESRKRFGKDTSSLRLHLKVLEKTAKLKNIQLESYPLVLAMADLFNQESQLAPEQLEEKMRSIRSYEFFNEMDSLEEMLYSRAAVSRDEKLLIDIDRHVMLLEKLASLSLTQDDFRNLEIVWPIIQRSDTWKDLDDLFKRRNISFKSRNLISSLLPSFENARDFYVIAQTRDSKLTKNVEKIMDITGQKIVFVVAGGFHTQGMIAGLRERGISYAALMPMANPDEDETRYWNRLSGTRSEIQTALAGTSTMKPESLQADSAFQQEAVNALLVGATTNMTTVEGQSLGIDKAEFEKMLRDYGSQLWPHRTNQSVAKKIQMLQEALAEVSKIPGPKINLPLDLNTSLGTFRFHVQEGRLNFDFVPPSVAAEELTLRSANARAPFLPADKPKTPSIPLSPPPAPPAPPPMPAVQVQPADRNQAFIQHFNRQFAEKFELIKKLGEGAMGAVFLGKDSLGRERAFKFIKDTVTIDDETLQRFRREAVAMAQVNNPGLVRSHHLDLITMPDGKEKRPFYVMDVVSGADLKDKLADWIKEGKIPALDRDNMLEMVKLMKNVAESLDLAHKKGIIHRDLKPANIIIRAEDGSPVITDFGMTRILESSNIQGSVVQRLTREGDGLGTPVYMAPEQANGELDSDRRIDVWALGAILYQLLTGKPPFSATGNIQGLLLQIMTAPVNFPPEMSAQIPADLKAIVLKSLQKKKEDRYPTAKEFANDLGNFLNDMPTNAQIEASRRQRNRLIGLGVASIVVLVLSIIGVKHFQKKAFDEQQRIQRENTEKFDNAKREVGLADQEMRSGNYDSAISHLNQAGNFLRQLDRREDSVRTLNDEIDVKTRFVSTMKAISDAVTRLNSNQRIDLAEFRTLADQLVEISNSRVITEELRGAAQLSIARARILQAEPDFRTAAGILNNLHASLTEKISRGEVVQRDIQEVNSAIIILLRKSREASFLEQEVIAAMVDFGQNFSTSLVFGSLSISDQASVYMNLGYLSSLYRSERSPSPESYFELAANAYNRIYNSETNAALKEEALWLRGIAELSSGKNEDAISTFNALRQDFPSSSRMPDSAFRIAQAWNEIGVINAKSAFDARLSARPFAENLAGMRTAFRSARLELKNMLIPLEAQPMNDLMKLRLESALVDSYFLELASIAVMYRNLLMFSPQRTQDPLLGDLYQYRNVLEREVRDDIENPNSRQFRIRQFSIEFIQAIQSLPENGRISPEDAERLLIAVRFYEMLGILKGLQNADFVNAERVTASARDSATYFDSLARMTTPFQTQGVNLIRPYLRFLQIARGTERTPAGQTFLSEGLVSLAEMYQSRMEAIRNRSQDPQQLQRIRDHAQRASGLLIQDPTLSRFAAIMTQDARGRSLGAAPDVYKDVKDEKRLSPIIMEFNEAVLKQLMDEGSDLRQGNKKLPVFFLVRDKSEIKRIEDENPTLWKDYRIGLLEWKKDQPMMSEMLAANVKTLLNLPQLKIYLGRFNVTETLSADQVVFMNDSFGSKWEEGTRRIKFNRDSFNTNEEYRSAYLAAGFYLVNHGKGEGVFQYNTENQTLELLPSILADLVSAWKALKQVLVAA